MKKFKKALSFLLVFCLALGMLINVYAASPADSTQKTSDDFYKIVHLDCGRKYFSVDSVKKLIDAMAKTDYNQLELAFGNAGLRFLLDDMSVEVSDEVSYSGETVKKAIKEGNKLQNGSNDESYWTENDMGTIIAYAESKGIEIVPLLNMPGHMNAILNVNPDYRLTSDGKTSASTIDLNNTDAYDFGLALLQKYVNYFKGKVNYFNFGADEYANDLYNPYFSWLSGTVNYTKCADYMNECAGIISAAGMTPRAFNDNICYNNNTTVSKDIQVCYWSNQWSGSPYATASAIANEGYTMINTNQNWYYVPGSTGYSLDTAVKNAKEISYNKYKSGEQCETKGAMVCIWNDDPNAATDTVVISNAVSLLTAFAEANSSLFTIDNTDEPIDVTQNKTITVPVGGTATDTIQGVDYSDNIDETELDKSIATVSADYEQVTGEAKVNKVTSITSGQSYLISDGNGNYLTLSGSTITNSTDPNTATKWTITNNGNSYTIKSGNSTLSLYSNSYYHPSVDDSQYTTWSYDAEKGIGDPWDQLDYSLYYNDGWKVGSTSSGYGAAYTLDKTEPVNATAITFTGVKIGTTYVTVGNTRYTINVVAEDLGTAQPLTIHNYITNKQVTGTDNGSVTETIAASQAYGKDGVEFSTLVPQTGTFIDGDNANSTQNVKFWIGRYQVGDQIQKQEGWSNHSHDGEEIIKVRYYGGTWAIYNGQNWINVASSDAQITAFYIQKTTVTEEVTTYVVDWGQTPENIARDLYNNFAVLDFAVKYESGERVPETYTNEKTLTYNSSGLGSYDTAGTEHAGYRLINEIYAEETADYEVYMITVTPSSNIVASSSEAVPDATNVEYSAGEKVVWVDDEADLGDFADESTHYEGYSVGGSPVVPKLYIQQQYGMLVTYYVRAKVTEDSLSVHYIDQTANQEFYSYNIAVNEGTIFDSGIGLDTPWKGDLKNGSITNINDKTQVVSADLSTMPAIGAQYRYSGYTCKNVERSQDGKSVYLYYTFDNTHSFVVDFGLPLKITTSDLNINGDWTTASVTRAKYGTATVTAENVVTYTPTETFGGIEALQLTLSDGEESVTHQIYIYPATSVYYEESFAALTGFEQKGTALNAAQATQNAGKSTDEYGYDAAYADDNAGSSNGTYATSSAKGNTAAFSFTGTGVDIYVNSAEDTGNIAIQVRDAATNRLVKVATVQTTSHSIIAEEYDNTDEANLIAASVMGLTYGSYTVKITTTNDATVNFDGFRVYGTLEDQKNSVYIDDAEDDPTYIELRDYVLTAMDVEEESSAEVYAQIREATTGELTGAVLNNNNAYNGKDLLENGPKNELFLLPGESVVFKINTDREVQVGLKAPVAETSYRINSIDGTIKTSTDMFYAVLNRKETASEQKVTITNTGNSLLSVTKIKVCDDPNATLGELTEDDIDTALKYMNGSSEPTEPEVTYADASLTVQVNDATTVLIRNGVVGETATFTAAEIKDAAESLVADGYNLNDAAYKDVDVTYGNSDTVIFTASEDITAPEPTNIFQKIANTVKNFFGKLFGRR